MEQGLSKIDRIKNSTIELVAENGFNQISVSDIAKHANVSTGYLYRYYESKKELIIDIITEMQNQVFESVKKIFNESKTVKDVCDGVVDFHYHVYKNYPQKLKFMVTLINDFGLISMKDQQIYITQLCELFYTNFMQKEGVRDDIKLNEVYIALIIVPLQSFAVRLRGSIVMNQFDEASNIETIKNISFKILKAD